MVLRTFLKLVRSQISAWDWSCFRALALDTLSGLSYWHGYSIVLTTTVAVVNTWFECSAMVAPRELCSEWVSFSCGTKQAKNGSCVVVLASVGRTKTDSHMYTRTYVSPAAEIPFSGERWIWGKEKCLANRKKNARKIDIPLKKLASHPDTTRRPHVLVGNRVAQLFITLEESWAVSTDWWGRDLLRTWFWWVEKGAKNDRHQSQ